MYLFFNFISYKNLQEILVGQVKNKTGKSRTSPMIQIEDWGWVAHQYAV